MNCNGYRVSSKIKLNGCEGREVHKDNYAQTTSVCAPVNLTATEIYRVDRKL